MKKELALKICDLIIEEGVTCKAACTQLNVSDGAFFRMVNKDSEVAESYARARQVQSHRWIDEIVTIADDSTNDYMQTENGVQVNHEHLQRTKIRVDTRKWLAAKALPKIYGDKLNVDGNIKHENTTEVTLTDEQLKQIIDKGVL